MYALLTLKDLKSPVLSNNMFARRTLAYCRKPVEAQANLRDVPRLTPQKLLQHIPKCTSES